MKKPKFNTPTFTVIHARKDSKCLLNIKRLEYLFLILFAL